MQYKIKKWSRLDKNKQVNPFDLGSYLSENSEGIAGLGGIAGDVLSSTGTGFGTVAGGAVKGAAAGTAVLPGLGTIIGGGLGLIGGLFANKQRKEQEELQRKQMLLTKQKQLNSLPVSGGGLPGFFADGGYLTSEILAKSGIYIKPENKGKFTATKKATGKTTEELTHSKNPLTRKRAIFAQNAKKWKHEEGGYMALGGPENTPKLYNPMEAEADSKFQRWYRLNTLEGQEGTPFSDKLAYDYYSFYKNTGGKANKGNIVDHFPDTYKRKSHPTFSNESLYSTPEKPGGYWDGETYITNGKFKNKLAKGGLVNPLSTQNGSIVMYNAGGTHSQNPLGGIPLSKSKSGKQNTVEQGESSFKFKEGKYIFSNRLKVKK